MHFEKVKQCCDFTLAAMDGAYGWGTETVFLLAVVLVFNFLVNKLLKRLHYYFDKQGQIWHDSFVRALYKPLSYYVWFFAFVHAIDLIVSRVTLEATLEDMHRLLAVGAVLSLAWFFLRWKKNILLFMSIRSKNREIALDISKLDMIDKLTSAFIVFVSILMILEITDRSINTLIAFSGIGGLAIAFASQDIVSNFFAGIMIYATHPFSKGDWIQVPDRNIEGIVEDIGWYMIRLKSLDKRPLYVPNTVFSKAVVVNPSRMIHRQFKEVFGLRYEDLPRVKGILTHIKEMLQNHPDIDGNLTIGTHFSSFGTAALELTILAFTPIVNSEAFATLKDDLLFKITDIITTEGAEMPYPAPYVYLSNLPPVTAPKPVSATIPKIF